MKPAITGRTRVLHVEQNAKHAHLLQNSLSKYDQAGLEFVRADSVANAIAQLSKEEFDLVLMEPASADREPLENIREMCEFADQTPVVALTANVDEDLAIQSMQSGLQNYLIKSQTDGTAVLDAIRLAVGRSNQEPSSIPANQTKHDESMKILLVEDNPGDALLIEENLSTALECGCSVVTVDRLNKAINQLASGYFSAAVVDLTLPDSRGLETCEALRKQSPELPIIVHTGSSDESLASASLHHGATDFLVKGRASGRDLVQSVQSAIQRLSAAEPPTLGVPAPQGLARRGNESSGTNRRSDRRTTPAVTKDDHVPTNTPRSDRRIDKRHQAVRSAVVIPIGSAGRPEWDSRMLGKTSDVSQNGVGLLLETTQLKFRDYMLGIEGRDGAFCYTGLEIRHSQAETSSSIRAGCRFGGRGQEILKCASGFPTMDPVSMQLTRAVPADVLAAWCEVDVLRPMVLDRVLVCPKCSALPTFRLGCQSCGSGRIANERLIHHFACAHVGPFAEYERPEGLVCPKCRGRNLIVGSDFEYQLGVSKCPDCRWHGTALEQVGQCLCCGFRFPGTQALTVEITGYHVHRLDPLDFIPAG